MNKEYQTTINVCAEIQRHAMESAVTAARVMGKIKIDVPVEQLPDALADMNAKFKPIRIGMANAETSNSMMELVRAEIEAIEQGALPFKKGEDVETTDEELEAADAKPPRGKKLRKVSTKGSGYRMEQV